MKALQDTGFGCLSELKGSVAKELRGFLIFGPIDCLGAPGAEEQAPVGAFGFWV